MNDGDGTYQFFEDGSSSDYDATIEPKSYRITDRDPTSSAASRVMSTEEAAAKFSSLCPNHERTEAGEVILHTDPIEDQAWARISAMTSGGDVQSSSSSSTQPIDIGAQFATALILASTIELYDQDSYESKIEMYDNLKENYDKLYPVVFAFLTSVINFACTQSQDPTNDQLFLDPQAIVTFEVITAITYNELSSKVNTKEVRDLRKENLKVPLNAALCLSTLLSDEYDKPPHRHFSKDRARAARHYFRRIRHYEEDIINARNNTLIGKNGADELPVAVKKAFPKYKAFIRGVGELTFETKQDGKPVYVRTHGVIEFEDEVFRLLLKDLEECTVKYYLGKITYPKMNKPIAVFLREGKSYIKLSYGIQLFEALRINYATSANRAILSQSHAGVGLQVTDMKLPSTTALEARYPANLILSKTVRDEERKLPQLDVSDFTTQHVHLLGLNRPLLSTSYWAAYRHSDFKELKHQFHDEMLTDALKLYSVSHNALDNKNIGESSSLGKRGREETISSSKDTQKARTVVTNTGVGTKSSSTNTIGLKRKNKN
jgi:hypothetical protein